MILISPPVGPEAFSGLSSLIVIKKDFAPPGTKRRRILKTLTAFVKEIGPKSRENEKITQKNPLPPGFGCLRLPP
jgi:hypothetical protein